MSPDLPQYIEPARLADNADSLEGEVGLENMHRLQAVVEDPAASIRFSLSFSRTDSGGIMISGEFHTRLVLRCQRCLEPLAVTLNKEIRIGCVTSKAEADALPADLEPLLMADNDRIALLDMIEDEVLLGLPMSPVHEEEECTATDLLQELKATRESPFDVLKDLKTDNH